MPSTPGSPFSPAGPGGPCKPPSPGREVYTLFVHVIFKLTSLKSDHSSKGFEASRVIF